MLVRKHKACSLRNSFAWARVIVLSIFWAMWFWVTFNMHVCFSHTSGLPMHTVIAFHRMYERLDKTSSLGLVRSDHHIQAYHHHTHAWNQVITFLFKLVTVTVPVWQML
jgi:hypothetical protein